MKRRWIRIVWVVVVLAAGLMGVYGWQLSQRPPRTDLIIEIEPGVTYYRRVFEQPRPLMAHLVVIELDVAEGRLFVTPGGAPPPDEIRARPTSAFAAEFGALVAINGSYFAPIAGKTPLYFYPRSGDPVQILGPAVSDGVAYSSEPRASLCVSGREVVIELEPCVGDFEQVLAGDVVFMRAGSYSVTESLTNPINLEPQPRSAVSISEDGRRLIWAVVDGRQPGYSEGVTLRELADIMIPFGAFRSLTLDGGGSSTLVIAQDGRPQVMNSPIHVTVPGWERPVGNHLGWVEGIREQGKGSREKGDPS